MLGLRSISYAATIAGALAFAGPVLANETYAVTGAEPGATADSYTGKAVVTKDGDTWTIVWTIKGDAPVKGTGVMLDGYLAATGTYEGKPFVFLLKKDGPKFSGVWTLAGMTKVDRETWTPQ